MCSLLCVCIRMGKCRALIQSMGHHTWLYVTSCHVSRLESQDNMRVSQHSSITKNAWRSPTRLMKVSMVRSAVLAIYRNLSSTESSSSARRTEFTNRLHFSAFSLHCRGSSSPIDGVYHCRCQITYVWSHTWRFQRSGRRCRMVPSP